MRTIEASKITDTVASLALKANCELPADVREALQTHREREESPIGRDILRQLADNADIARQEQRPICQDTGVAVVFVDIGQEVHIAGGYLEDAINAGIARGYTEGYLRKSVVAEPLFQRVNTGNNTPGVIHVSIVPGDKLKIIAAPKGVGSENMSAAKMLRLSDGVAGVKQFVVDTVIAAGPNPCPPIVVGVGVGGNLEKSALIAKRALLRPLQQRHFDERYAQLEAELLELINNTGIGPQGLGGRVTALAVHVEYYPSHMAGLPVAVNINCHAARHAEAEL